MGLKEQIMNDYKQAMRDRDELKKSILNYLISQIRYKRIELGRDLTDEEIIGVIKKEIKSRKEALDLYTSSGHKEMSQAEESALEILKAYMPPLLNESQTKELVNKYISEFKEPVSPKLKGKLIGTIMKNHKTQIDPQLLSKVIDEQLNSK